MEPDLCQQIGAAGGNSTCAMCDMYAAQITDQEAGRRSHPSRWSSPSIRPAFAPTIFWQDCLLGSPRSQSTPFDWQREHALSDFGWHGPSKIQVATPCCNVSVEGVRRVHTPNFGFDSKHCSRPWCGHGAWVAFCEKGFCLELRDNRALFAQCRPNIWSEVIRNLVPSR